MARKIKYSQEDEQKLFRQFLEAVKDSKLYESSFNFQKAKDTVERKARVVFSEKAWVKMQDLVRVSPLEVGWHGIVTRGYGEDENAYYVSDILLFKQTVSGGHFTTDQAEYEKWLCMLPDDDFSNLRLHGHSHVNMAVMPSARDAEQWHSILDGLSENNFQIFMIWNKRGEHTCMIYDKQQNVVFDTADCEIIVADGEYGIAAFENEAKELVKEEKVTISEPTKTPEIPAYTGSYGKSSYEWWHGFNPNAKKPSHDYNQYDEYDDEWDDSWR